MTNFNLCEILKGLEGTQIYCALVGDYLIIKEITDNLIKLEDKLCIDNITVTSSGSLEQYPNGECIVFPSKEVKSWNKFIKPYPIDTPMMCCNLSQHQDEYDFRLRYYKGIINKRHYCTDCGYKSGQGYHEASDWDIMIPFDKFNQFNLKENLKNNIQRNKR